MKIKISYRSIIGLIMFLYVISASLCLNEMKMIAFILLVCFSCPVLIENLKTLNIISFYGLVYPIAIILISTIVSGDLLNSIQNTYCCFLILMVFVIKDCKLDYKKMFYAGTWIITILTVCPYILDIIGIIDINQSNFFRDLFYKYDIGLMGKHSSYYLYYSVFLYASPLMIFLFFKKVYEGKKLQAFVALIGIIATGERTPIFFTLLGLYIYIFTLKDKKKRLLIGACTTIVIIFIVALYKDVIWEFLNDIFFVKGSSSNNTRIEHIKSIINLYKDNPYYLIFGMGMGSEFFTSAWGGKIVSSIELSFLDLMRQMGMLLFFPFLLFLIYPIKRIKLLEYEVFSYVIYLIIAALNPYLFDSTAFLVYTYMYCGYKRRTVLEEE